MTDSTLTAAPATAGPLLIYTRVGDPARLKWPGRLLAGAIGAICLTTLLLAVRLHPSPTGMATHTAMGFEECQFLKRTRLPCPSCGMTTSFSWFVRGNVPASFYVQPMGFVLAVLTAATAWAAWYIAITGKPAHRLMRLIPARYYLLPLLCFAAIAWGWKMFIHLQGIDGWG
ncbi:MAG: DUF2752 domain-containing protein [Anaerolineae bacterium]|nr:DUF2752 domain-containing protein [Phycisphaerae bacterium]